jgi:hypothetical protein
LDLTWKVKGAQDLNLVNVNEEACFKFHKHICYILSHYDTVQSDTQFCTKGEKSRAKGEKNLKPKEKKILPLLPGIAFIGKGTGEMSKVTAKALG